MPVNAVTTVTMADVMRRLAVSYVTIYNWRTGAFGREPLAASSDNLGRRPRVQINERVLKEWLERHRPDLLQRWLSADQNGTVRWTYRA